MKYNKNFLKSITIITVLLLVISIIKQNANFNIDNMVQANLFKGLRTVKVSEEKIKIEDKNILINTRMPQINYQNYEVERYINTYIRKNINEFINHQRQYTQLNKEKAKKNISINYHVPFEDSNMINIVIYKSIETNKDKFELEKDSYVFDLKTGQRVYLDNLLKDNPNYENVINNYIDKYINKNHIKVSKDRIKIDKYTNYIIEDGGLLIYFNPYKNSEENINYEFKIPYEVFSNKIRIIQTDEILANIDTQTLTENNKNINSIINIPIVMTKNKNIEKNINDKIRNDIMEFYNSSKNEAKEYNKNFPENTNKFVANVDFYTKKNSDNMLSILLNYYKYSGGSHGYYEYKSYNIDMRSGKFLELEDLFKSNSDYKKVINNEIRRQIEYKAKSDSQYEGIYQFERIKDNQKFYIQDNNLIIYFDLYEIAPYAAGIPEFQVNINIINHILKEEYIGFFK